MGGSNYEYWYDFLESAIKEKIARVREKCADKIEEIRMRYAEKVLVDNGLVDIADEYDALAERARLLRAELNVAEARMASLIIPIRNAVDGVRYSSLQTVREKIAYAKEADIEKEIDNLPEMAEALRLAEEKDKLRMSLVRGVTPSKLLEVVDGLVDRLDIDISFAEREE